MTTHSASIVAQVPEKNLLSIRRNAGKSKLAYQSETKQKILKRLGLQPRKRAILFVEDSIARIVLRELIGRLEANSTFEIEIVVANGHAAIRRMLESAPIDIKSVALLGILDGDMKEEAVKWEKIRDRLIFLPFKKQIKDELLSAAENAIMKFAKVIERTTDQVERALEATRGQDSHDKMVNLSTDLALSAEQLCIAAFSRWSAIARNRSSVKKFAKSLERVLK